MAAILSDPKRFSKKAYLSTGTAQDCKPDLRCCSLLDAVVLMTGLVVEEDRVIMDYISCINCGTRTAAPYRYSTKMCSHSCDVEWELRAAAAGGYHVLVRDQKIAELKELVAALLAREPTPLEATA